MLGVQSGRVIRRSLLGREAVCAVRVELDRLVLELVVSLFHDLFVFELYVLGASMRLGSLHVVWPLVVLKAIRRMGLVRCALHRWLWRYSCILLVEWSTFGH